MSTFLNSLDEEIDVICHQRLDEILFSLFFRYQDSEENLDVKLNRYVSLKLMLHHFKKRINKDYYDGDMGSNHCARFLWLILETKKARKDYYDAKRRIGCSE